MNDLDQEHKQAYIFDFITRHPFGTVSTLSASGTLGAAALYVGVKTDLTCYFGTRTNTEKFENISHNPNVTLTIADELTLETLQLRGTASIITEGDKVRDAMESLQRIVTKEKPKWIAHPDEVARGIYKVDVSRWVAPVGQIKEGASVFIKIKPNWLRYRRYNSDWKTGEKYTEYLMKEM